MSETLQMTDKDQAQQMIGEMQGMIEKQKELLQEQSREIEALKTMLAQGKNEAKQDSGTASLLGRDEFEAVYRIMASLEKYTTEEVLFYAAQTLADSMDTGDVAIYTVANRDYARLFSATSAEARKLGNSIKYTDMDAMYSELKSGRIYLNKDMEPGLPLMAGALYAEEVIQVILMFWGIPSDRLDALEVNRLTVIEALLQNAILRASRYMMSFKRHRYIEGTNVLNEKAFTGLVKVFLEAKKKGLTECALVEVMMGYQDYEDVALQITGNIRQTDYMGLMNGEKLYILLANTDMKNAEVVRERLKKLDYDSILKGDLE